MTSFSNVSELLRSFFFSLSFYFSIDILLNFSPEDSFFIIKVSGKFQVWSRERFKGALSPNVSSEELRKLWMFMALKWK